MILKNKRLMVTRRIIDRNSNTRIDNGIWISIDEADSETISKKR